MDDRSPPHRSLSDLVNQVEHLCAEPEPESRLRLEGLIKELLMTDPLTGCNNRLALDEALHGLIETGKGALVSLDVDHFKQVNDRQGHQAGDAVLCRLVELIREAVQVEDALIRSGGDEFLVVLTGPAATNVLNWAEALRQRVSDLGITVSMGVLVPKPGETLTRDQLLERVDQALYASKHAGRNRCTLSE